MFYWGKECQAQDWKNHKPDCQANAAGEKQKQSTARLYKSKEITMSIHYEAETNTTMTFKQFIQIAFLCFP